MVNYYNKDLYKILGVNFDADESEIKSAYRKLVRIYHPDAGAGADVEKFREVQEAYEVLSDEESRKKYDVLLGFYMEKIKKDFKQQDEQRKTRYDDFVKKAKKNANQPSSFSKSVNEALDNLFHSSKQPFSEKEMKISADGKDINLDISVTCFEALNGTNRKVNILHTEPCPKCGGRTFINGSQCSMCSGTGQISLYKKINVKIPKGVKHGSKVRVKKEGNKGVNGGKDGDLYLIVKIEKNPYYEIEGVNILCNLPITPFEAVFGAEIPIYSADGKVTVKIPPMTSSGQKLKLASLGLYNKSKTKRGDIIVTVYIKLPETLSEEEKELYEKLKKLSSADIRKDMENAAKSIN